MPKIYLDNNSTTQVDPAVIQAMLPYFNQYYGNPSNLHSFGRDAKEAMEQAREEITALLSAEPQDIIFTSSGSEANNLAIKGILRALENKGNHIIISPIEHSSINHSLDFIQKYNVGTATVLKVDQYGIVDPDSLRQALTSKTILVSVMHCNNETGTIEPIKELCEITHKAGAYFHTDAVASTNKIPLNVKELGVDLLTISAHKIHGPKGVGALFVKQGIQIENIIHGGKQEHGMRGGTENLPGIVGFGKAAVLAKQDLENNEPEKIKILRDYLEQEVIKRIPEIKINGHQVQRVCNISNISVAYVEGEALLMNLDLEGIAVASGSACSTGKSEPSHVLKAMGVEDKYINSPVRFSLDKDTTKEEIDYTVDTLVKIVNRLRAISPLWKSNK